MDAAYGFFPVLVFEALAAQRLRTSRRCSRHQRRHATAIGARPTTQTNGRVRAPERASRSPRAQSLVLGPRALQRTAKGAIPYDIAGVELGHVGELCSFDAFLTKYRLEAPGLARLATIVRGADTSRLDLAPESAGLYATSIGLSRTYCDDHELLRHGLVLYEALYAWCEVQPMTTRRR